MMARIVAAAERMRSSGSRTRSRTSARWIRCGRGLPPVNAQLANWQQLLDACHPTAAVLLGARFVMPDVPLL